MAPPTNAEKLRLAYMSVQSEEESPLAQMIQTEETGQFIISTDAQYDDSSSEEEIDLQDLQEKVAIFSNFVRRNSIEDLFRSTRLGTIMDK